MTKQAGRQKVRSFGNCCLLVLRQNVDVDGFGKGGIERPPLFQYGRKACAGVGSVYNHVFRVLVQHFGPLFFAHDSGRLCVLTLVQDAWVIIACGRQPIGEVVDDVLVVVNVNGAVRIAPFTFTTTST